MRPHHDMINPGTVFVTADNVPNITASSAHQRLYTKLASAFERHCMPLGHRYLLLSRLDGVASLPDNASMVSDSAFAEAMIPIGGVELQLTDGGFAFDPLRKDAYDGVHSMVLVHVPTFETSGQPLAITLGPCTLIGSHALLAAAMAGRSDWDTHIEAMMSMMAGDSMPGDAYFVAPSSSWESILARLDEVRMSNVIKEYAIGREVGLLDELKNKREKLSRLEFRMDSLEKQIRVTEAELKDFHAKPISYKGIKDQITEIMEHPGLSRVDIAVNRRDGLPVLEVNFHTSVIDAMDSDYQELGIRRIGELKFTMLFPSGRITVASNRNYGKRNIPHPHVGADGTPCLGNCSAGLADAAAAMDLVSAWHLLYGFATTFNSPDSWGRQYKYWPMVLENGELDDCMPDSEHVTECSECGCVGITDYDEYCEQDDLPYITFCEKCGEPVCQEGCAIFCDDNGYYYCPGCIGNYYCAVCDLYHSPGTTMHICDECDTVVCDERAIIIYDKNDDPCVFCCADCAESYRESNIEDFEDEEEEEEEDEDE